VGNTTERGVSFVDDPLVLLSAFAVRHKQRETNIYSLTFRCLFLQLGQCGGSSYTDMVPSNTTFIDLCLDGLDRVQELSQRFHQSVIRYPSRFNSLLLDMGLVSAYDGHLPPDEIILGAGYRSHLTQQSFQTNIHRDWVGTDHFPSSSGAA
jgi:hypothetical protein